MNIIISIIMIIIIIINSSSNSSNNITIRPGGMREAIKSAAPAAGVLNTERTPERTPAQGAWLPPPSAGPAHSAGPPSSDRLRTIFGPSSDHLRCIRSIFGPMLSHFGRLLNALLYFFCQPIRASFKNRARSPLSGHFLTKI